MNEKLVTQKFNQLEIGSFFKETTDGAWHIKTSAIAGEYRSHGVTGSPKFKPDELILVEKNSFLNTK